MATRNRNKGMQKHRVHSFLAKAKHQGFHFNQSRRSFLSHSEQVNTILEESPYDITPVWRVLSPFVVLAALGMAVWAAMNLSTPINDMLVSHTPLTKEELLNGQATKWYVWVIALSATFIGVLIGKMCDPTRINETDDLTGEVNYKPIFFVGVVLAAGYLLFHYSLAKYSAEALESPYILILNMSVAGLELVLGAFFLGRALEIFSIWFHRVNQWICTRRMGNRSQACDKWYGFYNEARVRYNSQAGVATLTEQPNANIIRALAYYSGEEQEGRDVIPSEGGGNQPEEPVDAQPMTELTTKNEEGGNDDAPHEDEMSQSIDDYLTY